MGVLNVTPDSFSDGGQFVDPLVALRQARSMAEEGAAIIDIGGESTRPGAESVSLGEELDRVIPVIEAVSGATDVPISIDTSKPAVMREAVAAGASMINDVSALKADGALQAAADLDVAVCLMHMKGEPRTMQESPSYTDVVAEVVDFLRDRIERRLSSIRDSVSVSPTFTISSCWQICDNCRSAAGRYLSVFRASRPSGI